MVTPSRAVALTLIMLLALASAAFADSKARIVRLSFVEGDVELDRGDGHGFTRAFLNMPVIDGARVWTRGDARAEVEFEDGSTIRLAPETIITFTELSLRSGGRVSLLDIQEGTAYFNIKRDDDDDFRIRYGQEEIALDKSSRFRLDLRRQDVTLAVFRGRLDVHRRNGQRLEVRKNETLTLDFTEPDRYYLAKGITEEAHDYWDRQREEDRVRYYADLDRYRHRHHYGYYDLHRHGSFFSVAGVGLVWRPFHVDLHWDPYGHGSWVWYRHRGYVWVSHYPWGWTPYHYGNWVFVRNRGWCWRSSPRINVYNFVNVTNVYNAPATYRAPRAPHVLTAANTPPPTPIINVDRGPRLGRDGREGRVETPGQVARSVNDAPSGINLTRNRPSRNVIDNDALERMRPAGSAPSAAPSAHASANTDASVSNDRPGRAGRDGDRADRNDVPLTNGDRPVRAARDADYDNVDYRSRRTSPDTSGPASNGPTTVTREVRDRRGADDMTMRGDGGARDVSDAPARTSPSSAQPSAPVTSERPTRIERSPDVYQDRGDRGDRSERSGRTPTTPVYSGGGGGGSAPPPSRPAPSPSVPMTAPQRSSPPPSAPPAQRESRGGRNNPR